MEGKLMAQAKKVIAVPPTGEGFCECCGRPIQEIKNELVQVPYDSEGKRQVGKHSQYKSYPQAIYDDNKLRNCRNCGAVLKDQDINSQSEFMGFYGLAHACQDIITGYTCSTCGHKEEF